MSININGHDNQHSMKQVAGYRKLKNRKQEEPMHHKAPATCQREGQYGKVGFESKPVLPGTLTYVKFAITGMVPERKF